MSHRRGVELSHWSYRRLDFSSYEIQVEYLRYALAALWGATLLAARHSAIAPTAGASARSRGSRYSTHSQRGPHAQQAAASRCRAPAARPRLDIYCTAKLGTSTWYLRFAIGYRRFHAATNALGPCGRTTQLAAAPPWRGVRCC